VDARLQRIKELISEKERVDAELESLLGGAPVKETKPRVCSNCNQEGHTSRNCPQKTLPLQEQKA
jgi:hypothetical protein